MHTSYFILSLLALCTGPLLWIPAQRLSPPVLRKRVFRGLDWLVLTSITLLIVFEVLPAALSVAGLPVLAAFTLGLLLPQLLELAFRHAARTMHLFALWLAIAGIALHTLVDGAMLASGGHLSLEDAHTTGGLASAIVLHRIPVAITVWWLLFPALGLRGALPALVLMAIATAAGFYASQGVAAIHALVETPWLQAITSGMILHAVFNRPHLHHHDHTPATETTPTATESA